MLAVLLLKSTLCSSTHGREDRALFTRATQVTDQRMPVTVIATAWEAGVTAAEAESVVAS